MPYFSVRPWSSTPHPGTGQPHEGCFPPSLRRPGAVSGLWRYHRPLASLRGHTLWRHGASVIPLCQASCGEGRKHEISEEEEEAGHPGVREALTRQNKSPSFRTRRSCPAPTVEPPRTCPSGCIPPQTFPPSFATCRVLLQPRAHASLAGHTFLLIPLPLLVSSSLSRLSSDAAASPDLLWLFPSCQDHFIIWAPN